MNSKNLKMVLNAIRNMVKKNRVAYKDYLGEETVDEVICEGVCQDKATPLIIKKNEKLQLGKMYQVAIDGVVSSWICKKGYNCIGIGPFLEYLIEHGKEPTDLTGMWIIGYVNANNTIAVIVDEPSFVGKTFVVSQTITRKKYDTKKLPVELLPDTVAFLGDVKSAVDAFKVVMFNATSASDNSEYGSIKNIDGSDVSAQTAFDISTNNPIRLREGNKTTEVVQIEWYDSTGASSDSTDVTAVILYTVTNKYLIGTLSTSI